MMSANNYHIYQCREKEGFPGWKNVEGFDPEDAAATYAEEYGVENGEIVTVRGIGSFRITVIMEPEFHADRITNKKA